VQPLLSFGHFHLSVLHATGAGGGFGVELGGFGVG
jgi:hypothetical protein